MAESGVSETLRAEIRRYNAVLERLRAVSVSKQQLQSQLLEIEEALSELEKLEAGTKVYKAVGRILVSAPKERIEKELKERKETLEVRLSSLQKQESLLKKQLEDIEKRISRKMGGAGAPGVQAAG